MPLHSVFLRIVRYSSFTTPTLCFHCQCLLVSLLTHSKFNGFIKKWHLNKRAVPTGLMLPTALINLLSSSYIITVAKSQPPDKTLRCISSDFMSWVRISSRLTLDFILFAVAKIRTSWAEGSMGSSNSILPKDLLLLWKEEKKTITSNSILMQVRTQHQSLILSSSNIFSKRNICKLPSKSCCNVFRLLLPLSILYTLHINYYYSY